jgi:hypothetical protein
LPAAAVGTIVFVPVYVDAPLTTSMAAISTVVNVNGGDQHR